ncbi:MAG TPA: hypothetical protein O0X99_02175, partial [Methanocorpusculum sp.]|nr:hypothetical protein [Methanocorpusculum sp.]
MSHKPVIIPPLLSDTIVNGILSIDNMSFTHTTKYCNKCGGVLSPYDTKKKVYATIYNFDGTDRQIMVYIRRYKCSTCTKLTYADEPFYPKTRIGSAIIELARTLSSEYSYSHASEIINKIGIKM